MNARWTPREDAMLGTMPDRIVAAEIGRTESAVSARRHHLGLAAHKQHAHRWTKRHLALLGTMSDAAVAAKIGLRRNAVIKKRLSLGIKTANPQNRQGPRRGG